MRWEEQAVSGLGYAHSLKELPPADEDGNLVAYIATYGAPTNAAQLVVVLEGFGVTTGLAEAGEASALGDQMLVELLGLGSILDEIGYADPVTVSLLSRRHAETHPPDSGVLYSYDEMGMHREHSALLDRPPDEVDNLLYVSLSGPEETPHLDVVLEAVNED